MRPNQFLHQLYWQQFEELVVAICQNVLGIGAKKFSDGRDGGRDSRFDGKADCFPSERAVWEGTFIIQAKHTANPIASCSDRDFENKLFKEEAPKLKKLVDEENVRNYIVFTNRKLSGDQHSKLVRQLQQDIGITNIEIKGKDEIYTYLNKYPEILRELKFDKFLTPFRFYEKDIRDVIILFDEQRDEISKIAEDQSLRFRFVEKEEKNRINGLGAEYFEYMQNESLSSFHKIEHFLQDPKNKEYAHRYENTASDLRANIALERANFPAFENLIEYLYEYIWEHNEAELKNIRPLVRIFLHFMYFNCDIGKKSD